jgi:outer membrane murein-binding lipoprotein Lpp
MSTPQTTEPKLEERVSQLEVSVQEIRFHHMAKFDAMSYGLAVLHSQHEHLQQELTGFRAEATAHLTALKTDITGLTTDVTDLKTHVTGLTTDVTDLKTHVTGLTTDVADVKSEQARQGTQLDAILRILNDRN